MILLCTLGLSWQVIPETWAVFDPSGCPLYALHPEPAARVKGTLSVPDELWVLTTTDQQVQKGLQCINEWWSFVSNGKNLRIHKSCTCDSSGQGAVEILREDIFRLVLAAGPDCILSLAGGRKTMSADLQRAGFTFGCQAMVHILPPEPLPEFLKTASPRDFCQPLPIDIARAMQPVLTASHPRSDFLDLPPAITAKQYPIPNPSIPGHSLWQEIDRREHEGSKLLINFHADLARSESLENWRGLYRLSPRRIEELRTTKITNHDLAWLTALPKADLHCHLGGILDLNDQIAVGHVLWDALSPQERIDAELNAQPWMQKSGKPGKKRWPEHLTRHAKAAAAAWILSHHEPTTLERLLWGPTQPRFDLNRTHSWKFDAYDHPGDLTGSTILQHPAAIIETGRRIRERCKNDGIAYLELRCSPTKYHSDFLSYLRQGLGPDTTSYIRIIVITGRHDEGKTVTITQAIDWTLKEREHHSDFIVGLDLAGNESAANYKEIAQAFDRAFAECLPITIHAGEGHDAENIWKAAYHLHADRIGHGLSIPDKPDLAARFRDRRICLELCPSSNVEVIGFLPANQTNTRPKYPLSAMLDLQLPLTICTDNPGISRTTLAQEYIRAAELSPQGLSHWQALALIKQGFLHAFLPSQQRAELLTRVDQEICTRLAHL